MWVRQLERCPDEAAGQDHGNRDRLSRVAHDSVADVAGIEYQAIGVVVD